VRASRVVLIATLVLAGVVATAAAAVVLHRKPAQHVTVESTDVPGDGGVPLSAYVLTPAGDGKFPLLVMPVSWGEPRTYYLGAAKKLAAHGYAVVTYAQRGFSTSGGEIDFAAKPTQADVSSVIDWALANLPARADEIGAVGLSYGGAVSLLAAERDPRIKAVVAMSVWADLAGSLFPNHTPAEAALAALFRVGASTGRLDTELTAFGTQYAAGDVTGAARTFLAMSPSRSAATHVAALNKNHPAVMLANGFQDSVLPPGQLVDFFTKLTGPKRLELSVGDHIGPEYSGLSGGDNVIWTDATAWLDHLLRAKTSGAAAPDTVRLQDVATRKWHNYPNWAAVGRPTTLYLGGPSGAASGTLGSSRPSGWTDQIGTGADTIANAPAEHFDGKKPYPVTAGVHMDRIDRSRAALWSAPAVRAATLVQGRPSLHVTVTPSAADVSLYVYLYDVDASGSGALMSYEPYTLLNATPGAASTIDIRTEPISWTVPAGHRLTVVVDTLDPRYRTLGTPHSTVTFSSPAGDPSTLAVPVG
jgi:putative CocE/NonD family hydrolase